MNEHCSFCFEIIIDKESFLCDGCGRIYCKDCNNFVSYNNQSCCVCCDDEEDEDE